jgi:hypothetical protein
MQCASYDDCHIVSCYYCYHNHHFAFFSTASARKWAVVFSTRASDGEEDRTITAFRIASIRRPVLLYHSPHLFCLLTVGVEVVYFHLITLRHTPQSVGLLWTKHWPVAGTSTWQHTTLTRDKHPCPCWDSNLRSQQALGRRPTP